MTMLDRSYYLLRAEAELAIARAATHPAAMRAHYHLAGYYLDKAHGMGRGDTVAPAPAVFSPA
ncbi:hypothetical protein ASE00_05515 [Sphingomonas sp. Root710]|uniref:hypothetical protein n=1 Tax=Sphingomonas sp. Root710 TaxID=1736594 RepID=UPI0006FD7127|nr:hypothetical protein [Sphingomonas sp. Root710]KRB86887.1 hypothetical protein ASE00_05515 [Sphingomonas sp. Root710]